VPRLVAAARERAAGFLGVDPSRAAWVRNVSEGVSAVLGHHAARTRLVVADRITSPTATVVPVAAVTAARRRRRLV
jgi:selenocysteine lyase/cysteine desulfurase